MHRDMGILGALAVGAAVLLSDGGMLLRPPHSPHHERSLDGYIWEVVIASIRKTPPKRPQQS